MKHPCLPQTMTPENLAEWIMKNNSEVKEHIEKTDLDEETIVELEKKSSLASRAIDRLEEIKKQFMNVLKDGTDGPDDDKQPYDITIPPTKGLKALKANRHFADQQIEQGYKEDTISIYMIPYPEDSLMVGVDIEGNEWPEFTREMTIEEINQNKPILKVDKKEKKEKKSFMEEGEDSSTLDL